MVELSHTEKLKTYRFQLPILCTSISIEGSYVDQSNAITPVIDIKKVRTTVHLLGFHKERKSKNKQVAGSPHHNFIVLYINFEKGVC